MDANNALLNRPTCSGWSCSFLYKTKTGIQETAFYVDAATVAAAAAPAAAATAVAAAMLLLLLTAVGAEAVLHVSLLNTIVRSIVYNMEEIFNVYNKCNTSTMTSAPITTPTRLSSSGARGCAIFPTALCQTLA